MFLRAFVPAAAGLLLTACAAGLKAGPGMAEAQDPACTDAAQVTLTMNRLDGDKLTILVAPDPVMPGKGSHIRWTLVSGEANVTAAFAGATGEYGIQAKNLQHATKLTRTASGAASFCAQADKPHLEAKERLLYNVVIVRSTVGLKPTTVTWICDPTIVNESKRYPAQPQTRTVSCQAE